jgi:hypothetical protein
VCRTTTTPVRNIKAERPWTVPQFPRVSVKHHLARNRPASPGTRQARQAPGTCRRLAQRAMFTRQRFWSCRLQRCMPLSGGVGRYGAENSIPSPKSPTSQFGEDVFNTFNAIWPQKTTPGDSGNHRSHRDHL